MSVTIQCPATVTTSATCAGPGAPCGAPLCLDASGAPVSWVVVPDFDPSMIDSGTAADAFSSGFILVATAWCVGKGVSLILKQIRG